jgi:uncharacterized phage protein (TIGR02220 family)
LSHKTRPRLVYPSIFDSRAVGNLHDRQFKLFIWLVTNADDDGLAPIWPELLASRPHISRPISPDEAMIDLHAIETAGLIQLYESGDEQFYYLKNWPEYQRIRPERYLGNNYPQPKGWKPQKPPANKGGRKKAKGSQPTDNRTSTNVQPQGQGQGQRQGQGQGEGQGDADPPPDGDAPSLSDDEINSLIEHLNQKATASFPVKPHLWRQVFNNLDSLDEPFTFEDCKQVIDGRVELWKHEPSMAAHLNPTTIFNPKKFFSYLGAGTQAGDSWEGWVDD